MLQDGNLKKIIPLLFINIQESNFSQVLNGDQNFMTNWLVYNLCNVHEVKGRLKWIVLEDVHRGNEESSSRSIYNLSTDWFSFPWKKREMGKINVFICSELIFSTYYRAKCKIERSMFFFAINLSYFTKLFKIIISIILIFQLIIFKIMYNEWFFSELYIYFLRIDLFINNIVNISYYKYMDHKKISIFRYIRYLKYSYNFKIFTRL